MATKKSKKTAEKQPVKLTRNGVKALDGNSGKKFSAEYQPSPAAKSEGRQQANARRKVIEDMAAAIVRLNLHGVALDKIRELLDNATDQATLAKAVELAIKAVATVKDNDKQEVEVKGNNDFLAAVLKKAAEYEAKHD